MKLMDPTYPFFLELRKEEGGAFFSPIGNQLKLRKRRALVTKLFNLDQRRTRGR